MPSSQAAATERRNDRMMAHEPPKLKTTLKTPPKQATNPLQFVKVGPCSLYRTAQEQLQKVQEVKKVKQEVRDDPEDWQSNLDNWKSSRRKRQEHIIERVVEVKKLELEEHDRQRRRSKTFSEMMEERGSRGRKLSMSLAMYHEEDSNDLSDLGIGTSSGKSSVSGDTHDDTQSVLSDRDSEIDKNHSDLDNVTNENGNGGTDNNNVRAITNTGSVTDAPRKKTFGNGFIADDHREYDSGTTATVSSPEPEEYTYEGAIRGYVSRVAQNIPRRSLIDLEVKLDSVKTSLYEGKGSTDEANFPVVKVDILKRREIFEKASQINNDNKINNNRSSGDFSSTKSIKERLSNLDKQMHEAEQVDKNTKSLNRLSGDMSSIRERLSHLEKQATERESKISRKPSIDELEPVRPLRERLSTLEKYASSDESCSPRATSVRQNGRSKEGEKKPVDKQILRFNNDNSTPSERSSSPDSEYRAPRAAFHRSLDSLDADASSGPDTFERVQSLEELDYTQRYPASASSAELLNDTDREDSGIHTADVSCSVSQADEPVDEEIVQQQQVGVVEVQKGPSSVDKADRGEEATEAAGGEKEEEVLEEKGFQEVGSQHSAVITEGTAAAGTLPINKKRFFPDSSVPTTSICTSSKLSSGRTIVYQSPRIPPRRSPPEIKLDLSSLNASEEIASPLGDADTESKSTSSPQKIQEIKDLASPVNKPSKIPTPLPRKSVSVKINSGTSSPSTPPSSPAKVIPQPKLCFKSSKIPSPLKCQQDECNQPDANQDKNVERRRTVVEICEKIVVPQGETPPLPVTPFIMVNEESIVIGSSSVDEEIVVPRAESTTPVEHEEEVVCTSESMVEVSVESPVTTRTNVEQETEIQIESDTEQVVMSIVSLSCDTETDHLAFEEVTVAPANTMEFIGTLSPTSKQIPQLNLENDEEIVAGLTFPLGPPSSGEPPKEKPPPPPTDFSDEENQPIEPLKRLNSTRRIKKELRTRRSDFLGIEGINDDDLELSLARPPDMAAILAEERRIEQLHRRSYDTDSNYEQDSSHERDSGVELGHADDWVKQPVSPDMSQHSRQSSEPFGASVTSSEEDEITKKEREIIEVLEKEEQWRYGSDREQNSDIGEKLADKLRELEEEKMQLERERQEETLRKNDENARKQEEEKIRKQQQQQQEADEKTHREEELRIKTEQLRLHEEMLENERRTAAEVRRQEEMRLRSTEDQIRDQEKTVLTAVQYTHDDEYPSGEVLRVERELLQLEQEELKRQRSNMAYREQKQQQLAEQLQEQWQSLQDVNHGSATNPHPTYQNINALNYRSSMPNLQLQEGLKRRPPPPPIPPAKPLRVLDQRQRDATIRNSRIPSADSIPQQIDASLRHSVSTTALAPQAGQQMTKQTLQALSAVPRTRIVKNDQWVQRRKSDGPRITQDFNYQHWLIQTGAQCQPGTAVNTPPPVPSAPRHDASKGASITGSLECRVTGENAQCQWKEEMLSLWR
ncbi:titin homolog isoform X2 [Diachasma alloeum]|uniref:titin homolog isoform X2 n=1 Tax=Diachasma alloeum TaxID=454923 RepID=UPI00073846CE|nr:titin homolog isoform X2 [Diachasma alloeum]